MKTIQEIINAVINEHVLSGGSLYKDPTLELLKDPSAKSTRKFNNIKKPSEQSRNRTFDGPRMGGPGKDGKMGKVSRIRKDKSSSYIATHPTLNIHNTSKARTVISPIKAKDLLKGDKKINLNKQIQSSNSTRKQKMWKISNSQTAVMYDPNVGTGTFFLINL
jgi:hypothetical protein